MKMILSVIIVVVIFLACDNTEEEKSSSLKDNRISLRTDTLNIVKMTDTMIIYESVCRGCAYEGSASFGISDSLGIVELLHTETQDNNAPEMTGGNISKILILVPKKSGSTNMKQYRFLKEPATAADSANFTTYSIQITN